MDTISDLPPLHRKNTTQLGLSQNSIPCLTSNVRDLKPRSTWVSLSPAQLFQTEYSLQWGPDTVWDGHCPNSLFWVILICTGKGVSLSFPLTSSHLSLRVRSVKEHNWHLEDGTVTHACPLKEAEYFQTELLQYKTRLQTQKPRTDGDLLLRS